MTEFQEEIPIKASSTTTIQPTSLSQVLYFFYYDPSQVYYSYYNTELLEDLLKDISFNMQSFLSEDSVKINKKKISLTNVSTKLIFNENKKTEPVLEFSISNDKEFVLIDGINIIELETEREILNYPIVSTWLFPGLIQNILSPLHYKINGFKVTFSADPSEFIGGYEKYMFLYGK